MRVSLVTAGTRGDVQPMVVLGAELRRRGHDVTLGVPPNLVPFASRAGFAALPVGPDSQAFMESPEGQGWLASGNVSVFMKALGKVAHDNAVQTRGEILRVTEGADVIVSGILTEDLADAIAEAHGIPLIPLHSAPARRTSAYPAFLVTTRQLPGPLNRLTGMLFDRVWWKTNAADVNVLRQQLGLAPASTPFALRAAAAGTLELQAYSAVLAPGIRDYGPNRPLIGFLTPSDEERRLLGETGLDADLEAWVASGDPPAYFGFGSMPVRDPEATLAMIESVTERLGLRALVSAGWSRLAHAAGERVRVVGALNHDAVMPRCCLAVHHGGAGTTAAGVAAGIPTLVCSVFADQPFWGERLAALGAGAHMRYAALTAATLETSLRRLLEPEVARRAKELGTALRAEGNAGTQAADLVEARVAQQPAKPRERVAAAGVAP
jgi:sterol 3beta-glucosyltransferase